MNFVADENFIYQATKLLEVFDPEHQIRHLVDYFERGTDDEVWLTELGREVPAPFILSGDVRILRNRLQRKVLLDSGLSFFALAPGWTNTPWSIYAWKIIKVWPSIVAEAARVRQPTVFEVTLNLKVEKTSMRAR